jgi:hypothetical protein
MSLKENAALLLSLERQRQGFWGNTRTCIKPALEEALRATGQWDDATMQRERKIPVTGGIYEHQ